MQLEEAIINCFNRHKGNYGRIRIRQELKSNNIFVSEHSIARILKVNGLKAKTGRVRKHHSPKPTGQQYYQENLIKDKFSVQVPNALWCSDISELKCLNSKLYVCGIIDVAAVSRISPVFVTTSFAVHWIPPAWLTACNVEANTAPNARKLRSKSSN